MNRQRSKLVHLAAREWWRCTLFRLCPTYFPRCTCNLPRPNSCSRESIGCRFSQSFCDYSFPWLDRLDAKLSPAKGHRPFDMPEPDCPSTDWQCFDWTRWCALVLCCLAALVQFSTFHLRQSWWMRSTRNRKWHFRALAVFRTPLLGAPVLFCAFFDRHEGHPIHSCKMCNRSECARNKYKWIRFDLVSHFAEYVQLLHWDWLAAATTRWFSYSRPESLWYLLAPTELQMKTISVCRAKSKSNVLIRYRLHGLCRKIVWSWRRRRF